MAMSSVSLSDTGRSEPTGNRRSEPSASARSSAARLSTTSVVGAYPAPRELGGGAYAVIFGAGFGAGAGGGSAFVTCCAVAPFPFDGDATMAAPFVFAPFKRVPK
jgi:hypothetical protein